MTRTVSPFAGLDRLPIPDTPEKAHQYFATRARQLLFEELVWMGSIEYKEDAVMAYFSDGKQIYCDAYNFKTIEQRYDPSGGGLLMVQNRPPNYMQPHRWYEYIKIALWYHSDRAERSQALKMNHIDEALIIMKRAIKEMPEYQDVNELSAYKAFCLHPLYQNDADLDRNWPFNNIECKNLDPHAIALAFEYRSVANEYLSHRKIQTLADIRLSPMKEVQLMLIGDKVQNYKDFLKYHKGTHPRSAELEEYFKNWLTRLNVNEALYKRLIKHIPDV